MLDAQEAPETEKLVKQRAFDWFMQTIQALAAEHAEAYARRNAVLLRRTTLVAAALGFLIRIRQYLINRSLWLDEAYLSLNIIHRTFAELWHPLDYHQGAPIGFLLLQKASVSLFGTSEYALRLVPLLAGVFSIFVFYKLANRTIAPTAALLAVTLFAISPPLIYYSSEVKQYSSDALIALLLCYLTVVAAESEWKLVYVALVGSVGSIAVWVSHPSLFVLTGTGTAACIILIARKEWHKLAGVSAALLLWLISFMVCYLILLRKLAHDPLLLGYWQSNFMPFPPRNVTDLKWFEDSFFGFFATSAGLRFSGLAALVFILGCISLFKRNRVVTLLLLSPALPTLVASGLHKYPFGGRLTLFLVPIALLLMAEGAEAIRRAVGNQLSLTGLVLFGLLFVDAGGYTEHHFAAPFTTTGRSGVMPLEEVKPVMAYIQAHRQPSDKVYVYHAAEPAFEYYAERTRFPRQNVEIGTASGDAPRTYESDLKQFCGRRVWVLFSHMDVAAAEPGYVRFYLALMGPRLDSFARPGAETDLYDLRAAEPSAALNEKSDAR